MGGRTLAAGVCVVVGVPGTSPCLRIDAPSRALRHPDRRVPLQAGLGLFGAPDCARAAGRTEALTAVGRDSRAAACSIPAPRPARQRSRRRRCEAGPGISPGVARGGDAPARTQDAPRCSASAGRAGKGTRRRTGSRPDRVRRAQTRDRRREVLPALAHRRSRRGPNADDRSSIQSDARAARCRRATRPSGVGNPPGMPV